MWQATLFNTRFSERWCYRSIGALFRDESVRRQKDEGRNDGQKGAGLCSNPRVAFFALHVLAVHAPGD